MIAIRQFLSSTGGVIYWPANRLPRGGVVCLLGSEGGFAGWNELNCALLAANGFAALAHNYTPDARWLTHPDIDNVPLDRTEAALMALRDELAPHECGIGLFGVSRGAEHALLLTQLLVEDNGAARPMRWRSIRLPIGLGRRSSWRTFRQASPGQETGSAPHGHGVTAMSGRDRERPWVRSRTPAPSSWPRAPRTKSGARKGRDDWSRA
jgi:hypothetical protein